MGRREEFWEEAALQWRPGAAFHPSLECSHRALARPAQSKALPTGAPFRLQDQFPGRDTSHTYIKVTS